MAIRALAPLAIAEVVCRIRVGSLDKDQAADLLVVQLSDRDQNVALRAPQPIGCLQAAEDAAHAIASLAAPFAASATGAVLRVNGGMTSLRVG